MCCYTVACVVLISYMYIPSASFWTKLKIYQYYKAFYRAKKKNNTLVSGNAGDKKIFTRTAGNLFF